MSASLGPHIAQMFIEDMSKCELASKIDLDELTTKVKRLDMNITKISNELAHPEKHGELFNTMMQKFVEKSFDLISKINEIQKRKKINLFVDGGINRENIKKMNVENIISGSDVLNSKDPREQIMRLKTFGRYL